MAKRLNRNLPENYLTSLSVVNADKKATYVCFWRNIPHWARAFSFTKFLDHTQRRTTFGRTPLDEWYARRRDLYLTTPNTHNRQTSMPPVGSQKVSGRRPTPKAARPPEPTWEQRNLIYSYLRDATFIYYKHWTVFDNCINSRNSTRKWAINIYFEIELSVLSVEWRAVTVVSEKDKTSLGQSSPSNVCCCTVKIERGRHSQRQELFTGRNVTFQLIWILDYWPLFSFALKVPNMKGYFGVRELIIATTYIMQDCIFYVIYV
jgi:hypothetical protein